MKFERPDATASDGALQGSVWLSGLAVQGYVRDPGQDGDALVVELLVDGIPHGLARADLFDATLLDQGSSNPYHGFLFVLPQPVFERAALAEVRLANAGTLIGRPLVLAGDGLTVAAAVARGHVEWLGGLRFGGWLASDAAADTPVRGLVDENKVVETRPNGWVTIDRDGSELAVRSFTFELPVRFADACAHRIEVIVGEAGMLAPGPLTFVAFDDGLAAFLGRHTDVASEQVRGALYDDLMPQSLPFAAIADWRRRFETIPIAPVVAPIGVVLVGEDNLDATLESLQEQGDAWIAGVMSLRAGSHEFESADLVAFLDAEAGSCAAVVFAPSGTAFLPGALQRLAAPMQTASDADCVYADTILDLGEGRQMPLAHAAFDRVRMIEQGYGSALFVLRREVARAAAEAGANSLPRLFLAGSGIEGAVLRSPLHIPEFLAKIPQMQQGPAVQTLLEAGRHLCASLDIQARIEPVVAAKLLPAIRLARRPAPCVVSAVVLARNDAAALRRCLAALKSQDTVHDLEIIVVDNDSTDGAMGVLLAEVASEGGQIVRTRGAVNVARSMNAGGAAASGSYILFIDQHVVLAANETLDELVSRCSSLGTGAVGGILTWPSGAIYDAGQIVGMARGTSRAFHGLAPDDPGYAESLLVAREVSAVTAALMMVERDSYHAIGGMDEVSFPRFFTAAAYCLAGAALGHRAVVTPHARAVWNGGADLAPQDEEGKARFARELAALRDRFPDALANDPMYSPLLNRDGPSHTALAWPPRDRAARRPRRLDTPVDGPVEIPEPASPPARAAT